MTNQILVTGATGNVGSQVVEQLLAAGIRPRVAVRSVEKLTSWKQAGVELVAMDLDQPETIQAAFSGVDQVFMVSPFVPNMVDLSARLLEAAKQAGVQQIVRLSALSQPGTQLSQWHTQVEEMIQASEIPATILRPNGFMQNFSASMTETIKQQNTFYMPIGDGKISFIDTRDIAAVAVAVFQIKQTGTYDLTGPAALSGTEVAEIFSTVLGRTIHYTDAPEQVVQEGMQQAGMPEPLVTALMELYASYKSGQAAVVSPAVEQLTGKPAISFDQYVRDYASAFS